MVSHDAGVGRSVSDEWTTALRELAALERTARSNAEQPAVARLRAVMTERGDTLTEIAVRVRYNRRWARSAIEATRKEASVRAIADA